MNLDSNCFCLTAHTGRGIGVQPSTPLDFNILLLSVTRNLRTLICPGKYNKDFIFKHGYPVGLTMGDYLILSQNSNALHGTIRNVI